MDMQSQSRLNRNPEDKVPPTINHHFPNKHRVLTLGQKRGALYFIGTSTGFVLEVHDADGNLIDIHKTMNVRHATPYTTFKDADTVYRSYLRQRGDDVDQYYSILSNIH